MSGSGNMYNKASDSSYHSQSHSVKDLNSSDVDFADEDIDQDRRRQKTYSDQINAMTLLSQTVGSPDELNGCKFINVEYQHMVVIKRKVMVLVVELYDA